MWLDLKQVKAIWLECKRVSDLVFGIQFRCCLVYWFAGIVYKIRQITRNITSVRSGNSAPTCLFFVRRALPESKGRDDNPDSCALDLQAVPIAKVTFASCFLLRLVFQDVWCWNTWPGCVISLQGGGSLLSRAAVDRYVDSFYFIFQSDCLLKCDTAIFVYNVHRKTALIWDLAAGLGIATSGMACDLQAEDQEDLALVPAIECLGDAIRVGCQLHSGMLECFTGIQLQCFSLAIVRLSCVLLASLTPTMLFCGFHC